MKQKRQEREEKEKKVIVSHVPWLVSCHYAVHNTGGH